MIQSRIFSNNLNIPCFDLKIALTFFGTAPSCVYLRDSDSKITKNKY